MIELLSMYSGTNNGNLFLSLKDATDRLGFSDWRAADAAFADLRSTGLITMSFESYFDIKTGVHSRARAWRLNWIDAGGERLAPEALPAVVENSLDAKARKRLRRRQSALKRYFKEHAERKFAVVDSTTLDARKAEIGSDPTVVSTTLKRGNGRKLPNLQMVETTVHLSYHGGEGAACGWWGVEASMRAKIRARLAMLAMAAAA
jgi:hypothetical protein